MPNLSGFKVGQVLSTESIANKDKLTKCEVDIGVGEPVVVVTNAKVFDKQRCVVATVGSKVEMGGEEVEVKKANVGGVMSSGMLCDSPMLGWVGGGAGVVAKLPESFAIGSEPPAEKPRGGQVGCFVVYQHKNWI